MLHRSHRSVILLVLTRPQRGIFDKVRVFVMENRKVASAAHTRSARLTMQNDFSARERKFIQKLAEDLRLNVRWDEYDEDDVNLVTWRFPGASEEESSPGKEVVNRGEVPNGKVEGGGSEGEWEDIEEEEEESRAAVDRVLKKYEKAPVTHDDDDGGFDARYERSIKEKMDEWKRAYYRVCGLFSFSSMLIHVGSGEIGDFV